MIQVPQNDPNRVSFVQKQVAKLEAGIASEQISKAARQEVDALSAVDNASFRLVKATEQMKAAEIAYHEAVAKGASNREELRAIYNNTLAGYRDADKAAEIAADNLALAKAATAGLREVSKAITSGNELKAAIKAAKSDEDKAACVAAAAKLKLPFFLPKGWKAQYGSVSKSVEVLPEVQITKDGGMKAFLVLCPACYGHDHEECDNCNDEGMVSDDNLMGTTTNEDNGMGMGYDQDDMDFGKAFTTDSLLTRDFQKSVAYQDYIFTKGGPGSGPEVGHPFRGNQHTGAIQEVRQKDGSIRRVGWKTRIKEYGDQIKVHTATAEGHVARAKELEAQGRHKEAADAHIEAKSAYERAAGAARGISNLHKEWADKGHKDASLDTAKSYYDLQTALRANEKQASLDHAERLNKLAGAA
jgi:hypothetical protein